MIPWETLRNSTKTWCENDQQGKFSRWPLMALNGSRPLSAGCSLFRFVSFIVLGSSPGKICSHSTLVMNKCKADQHAIWGYGCAASTSIHSPFSVSWNRFFIEFFVGLHWITLDCICCKFVCKSQLAMAQLCLCLDVSKHIHIILWKENMQYMN